MRNDKTSPLAVVRRRRRSNNNSNPTRRARYINDDRHFGGGGGRTVPRFSVRRPTSSVVLFFYTRGLNVCVYNCARVTDGCCRCKIFNFIARDAVLSYDIIVVDPGKRCWDPSYLLNYFENVSGLCFAGPAIRVGRSRHVHKPRRRRRRRSARQQTVYGK